VSIPPNPGLCAPRIGVGERSRSLLCADASPLGVPFPLSALSTGVEFAANLASPLGVHSCVEAVSVGVELCANLEGVVFDTVAIFVGDGLGVDCLRGDGDAGLSGRRKGEARGEP
jgi:hypothetical protein